MTTSDSAVEPELRDVFAEEAGELLERIEHHLVALEQTSDSQSPERLRGVQRALHTLKGAAGALEIEPVSRLCHTLEDGLSIRRKAGDRLDADDFDAVYRAVEFMFDWLDGSNSVDFETVIEDVDDTFETPPEVEETSPDDDPPPPSSDAPGATPEADSSNNKDRIGPRASTMRIASSKIDDLQAVASELIVLNLRQQEGKKQAETIRDHLADVLSEWRTLYAELREVSGDIPATEWRKLEHHASNLALDLKETYQQSYDYARWSVGHAGQLDRVSDSLEDGLRNIRMQPLGPFFDDFVRVLRDAARSEDKQARFDSRGRDIEVDRVVLERLREPLIHLVRNAVAHGLEPPRQRQQAGKPTTGRVRLAASPVGEKVRLTVSDDGAGIDAEHVRRRAVETGVAAGIDDASDHSLLELLTHPGFSTRGDADQVAGRGIGLEAVEATVTELGGTIEVDTTPGQGTTFSLTIPTSITTSEGLVVDVGSYRLGLQLMAVERVVRIHPDELRRLDGNDVVRHDGDPVAVVPLAGLVGAPEAAPDLSASTHPALILRHGNRKMAVVVDDIPGQMPMVVRPLGPQFDDVRHLAGGAVRADGSILPVVEHRALFRIASGRPRPAGTDSAPSSSPAEVTGDEPATILVVDDSITTRTLERNILEAADHRVVTAKDGAEALEILRDPTRESPVDLLVTDLDMPRIDGLQLCRTLREDDETDLPIIVVTSKGADEEKRRGLEAGADAYIVKGNFEQDHFMKTVNRFV